MMVPPNHHLLPAIENPSWHIETDADMSSFEDNKNVARRARRRRAADTHTPHAALHAKFGHFDSKCGGEECECVCGLSVCVWLEKCDSLWVYTRGETLYGIYGALSVRRAYRLPLFSSAFM